MKWTPPGRISSGSSTNVTLSMRKPHAMASSAWCECIWPGQKPPQPRGWWICSINSIWNAWDRKAMIRVHCARSWSICKGTLNEPFAGPMLSQIRRRTGCSTWLQDPHLAKAHILLARGTAADVRSALDITAALNEIADAPSTFGSRSTSWPSAPGAGGARRAPMLHSPRCGRRWRWRSRAASSGPSSTWARPCSTLLLRLREHGVAGDARSPHPGRIP